MSASWKRFQYHFTIVLLLLLFKILILLYYYNCCYTQLIQNKFLVSNFFLKKFKELPELVYTGAVSWSETNIVSMYTSSENFLEKKNLALYYHTLCHTIVTTLVLLLSKLLLLILQLSLWSPLYHTNYYQLLRYYIIITIVVAIAVFTITMSTILWYTIITVLSTYWTTIDAYVKASR